MLKVLVLGNTYFQRVWCLESTHFELCLLQGVFFWCFLLICVAMLGLYAAYSRHAVGYTCTIWQAYLFRDICQYCEMYIYTSVYGHIVDFSEFI